jgi:hypothetical protein
MINFDVVNKTMTINDVNVPSVTEDGEISFQTSIKLTTNNIIDIVRFETMLDTLVSTLNALDVFIDMFPKYTRSTAMLKTGYIQMGKQAHKKYSETWNEILKPLDVDLDMLDKMDLCPAFSKEDNMMVLVYKTKEDK